MGKRSLFVFGWPSHVGGADTRLVHTLPLWTEFLDVTLVPNDAFRLREREWVGWLEAHGARAQTLDEVPRAADALAIAFSNQRFFSERIAHRAKDKGLTVLWSSEMMWHHPGELEAVQAGLVDAVLYNSPLNRRALQPGYQRARAAVREHLVENFVDPTAFPYRPRAARQHFTIGRLSRADPLKYPEDFPVAWELLGLQAPRFRVMAWDEALAQKYRWHHFGADWELLAPGSETAQSFLDSLDAFVYPLGHDFTESWGRSVVEAMLTGLPVVLPAGHHFSSYPEACDLGYCCRSQADFSDACRRLEQDPELRVRLGQAGQRFARDALCDRAHHVRRWAEVFHA